MLSIIAGLLIGLGGAINLAVENKILGAFLFSIGLLTILHFKFELFTGKAGLLATQEIKSLKLFDIYCGNLCGCAIAATTVAMVGPKFVEPAAAITNVRVANQWYVNIILGILCGVLMYIAVSMYATKPFVTVMCVAGFILMGANHCVADMFYLFAGGLSVQGVWAIGFTTAGNLIGTNLIPILKSIPPRKLL